MDYKTEYRITWYLDPAGHLDTWNGCFDLSCFRAGDVRPSGEAHHSPGQLILQWKRVGMCGLKLEGISFSQRSKRSTCPFSLFPIEHPHLHYNSGVHNANVIIVWLYDNEYA